MQSTCYCGIYFLDIFILQFHALIHFFDFCSSKKITQIDSCSSAQTRDKSALNYRKQSIGSEEIFHLPDGCDTTTSKSKRGHFWWKIIICRRDNYTGTGGWRSSSGGWEAAWPGQTSPSSGLLHCVTSLSDGRGCFDFILLTNGVCLIGTPALFGLLWPFRRLHPEWNWPL